MIHQVAPQMIENIMKGKQWKKHEAPYWSKNNPHFPGLREAAIFHGRFLSEIPKVGVFNSPQLEPGKPPGLKSHTCEFVIFGLLTRCDWMAVSDGIKNGRWVNGPPQEIGAYVTKIGQKRRSALFIITGATSSTARPSGGEIKPL